MPWLVVTVVSHVPVAGSWIFAVVGSKAGSLAGIPSTVGTIAVGVSGLVMANCSAGVGVEGGAGVSGMGLGATNGGTKNCGGAGGCAAVRVGVSNALVVADWVTPFKV